MVKRPSRDVAEEAVRTLIAWAGDDPSRKELLETPSRVARAYEEFFSGYNQTIIGEKDKSFDNSKNYDDMVILKDIDFESHCEHHMVPIIGKASIAYIPKDRVIGLSKIARIVDVFSKRLQIQERLTIEIAESISQVTNAKGVGVVIESAHHCLTTRGAFKPASLMQTSHLLGCFKEENIRKEFWGRI
jgi:GTP cyclohydrolase IA